MYLYMRTHKCTDICISVSVYTENHGFTLTYPNPISTRELILLFFRSPFATPFPERKNIWIPYHWYMQLSHQPPWM